VSGDTLRLAASDHFKSGLVEKLDDGFERLGAVESPFTLRVPPEPTVPEKVQEATRLHAKRPRDERRQDELRSDPVTRNFDLWKDNMDKYDFPGVDTLSQTIQQKRAEAAADIARSQFNLSSIKRNISFDDPTVRGRYWPNPPEIELRTTETDFPGWTYPCVLAHELGHTADNQAKYHRRFYSEGDLESDSLFETQTQLTQARTLSERLRGEIIESDIPSAQNYRETNSEKAADAFAALVLEPEQTRQHASAVANRLESVFDDFFTQFDQARHRIDSAWLS